LAVWYKEWNYGTFAEGATSRWALAHTLVVLKIIFVFILFTFN